MSVSPPISVLPQSQLYPYGTIVKVAVTPPTGEYFVSWNNIASLTNNPIIFTLTNAGIGFAAQFGTLSLGETSLTIKENGYGHVALFPPKHLYNISETAGLIAVADEGQDFIGWSGDTNGTQNPILISMLNNHVITANFTKRSMIRVGTPLEGLVEGGFRLSIIGDFGVDYSILSSTNLFDWTDVGSVTNTYGTVQFTDPAAKNLPVIFYRALTQ